ncbi:MAG: phage tail tape measure protein [Pseudolabrys sp.]
MTSIDLDALDATYDRIEERQRELEKSANAFATTMSNAFARSVTSGKSFDDTLKTITLSLSNMALRMAIKPIASALTSNLGNLLGNMFDGLNLQAATGAVKPFATGGVIGTPTYFPLTGGGVGLAGEAGPEAIMPLTRGPDGKLGVATSGVGAPHVTVQIMTPDPSAFRRSEAYVTGQIARAVMRGQRGL